MSATKAAQAQPVLRAEKLSRTVHTKTLLSDISFAVGASELLGIVGPSGSGKSSLLRLLNRLDEPTTGTVFLNGLDYRKIPPRELRRRVGMVTQRPFMFPGTVASNVRFGPAQRGESVSDEQIALVLEQVGLPNLASQDAAVLSGGEQQRVSLARSLANHPEVHLMVLLLDERPEEVTDFRRSIAVRGEVLASSSDRATGDHLKVAEMALERARRMVEAGKDVVILLDSITRLARAYNKEVDSSGRTLTGGVDSRALERPKRIFGAARSTEEAGTLTIIGTALIDTGSRMDEVIFEEFKGTGNSEVTLDRLLSEKRIFPAINIPQSGTRKEEKLFTPKEYEKVKKLRQMLFAVKPVEAMEALVKRLSRYTYNDEFLDEL